MYLQGSDAEESQPKVRSPLSPLSAEKLSPVAAAENPFPKSPLFYNSSSHLLPPLKFHSGLLTPHSIVSPCLQNKEEDDDNVSVASVSDYEIGRRNYTEEDGFEDIGPSDFDYLEKPVMQSYQDEDEEEIFGVTRNRPTAKTKLNRGVLKEDLKIELPGHFRRLKSATQVDGDLGFRKSGTPKKNSVGPGGSFSLRERVQLRNAQLVCWVLVCLLIDDLFGFFFFFLVPVINAGCDCDYRIILAMKQMYLDRWRRWGLQVLLQ
jgi:hypothetical protein